MKNLHNEMKISFQYTKPFIAKKKKKKKSKPCDFAAGESS